MNDNQNPNSELGAGVNAAAGEDGAVAESLSLAELNTILGKDFKDKQTALNSLAETNKYVGKLGSERAELEKKLNETKPADLSSLQSEISALKEQNFYAQNPQYKGFETIIKNMGANPAEVVNSDAFKQVFEMGQKAAQADSRKSVVSSNNRIASQPSVLEEAKNVANDPSLSAEALAGVFVKGIIEEMGS